MLVAWLKKKSTTKQLQAAQGLGTLAILDAADIMRSHPPLGGLVGAIIINRGTANSSRGLSMNADNQALIGAAGAIPPLVALLGSTNVGVRQHSSGALANCSSEC